MKKKFINIIKFTIVLFVVTHFSFAHEHTTGLKAHVHGLSEITIAMEDEILEIQFTSPAMNLVGFEHKASTKKEIKAVESVGLQLRQHETLFLFSGGDCDHVKTSIDVSSLSENENHDHSHENHDKNDNHSDIIANYRYRCENKTLLSSLTVTLFKLFPGIHEIHAIWVMQKEQGKATLTPNNYVVEF